MCKRVCVCVCVLPPDESCTHMHTRSHWLTYTRTVILAQNSIPLCTLVLGLALFTYILHSTSCCFALGALSAASTQQSTTARNLSARQDFPLLRLAHAHKLTATHTHTRVRTALLMLGSCWGIYARVILVPIPVRRLLVTHTYHKTAGLIRSSAVCMSFGPFDQLIVHMSAGRP